MMVVCGLVGMLITLDISLACPFSLPLMPAVPSCSDVSCQNGGWCMERAETGAECRCLNPFSWSTCEKRLCPEDWYYYDGTDYCYFAAYIGEGGIAIPTWPTRQIHNATEATLSGTWSTKPYRIMAPAYPEATTSFSYKHARNRCQQLGANLVSVRDVKELQFAVLLINRLMAWIGLHAEVMSNSDFSKILSPGGSRFLWEDGTTFNLSNDVFLPLEQIQKSRQMELEILRAEATRRGLAFDDTKLLAKGIMPGECGYLANMKTRGISSAKCGDSGNRQTAFIGAFVCEKRAS